jgi:murein DD-endopeptidase MepM/ murein hydrolase activator NlpD
MRVTLMSRRRFLRLGVIGALAPACASMRSGPHADRDYPPYLSSAWGPATSTFAGHRGPGGGRAGVDYGRVWGQPETEICPAAAGVVSALDDDHPTGGLMLYVSHGLGWRTEYAHLKSRFARVGDRVERRDVIGLMGASGRGASRGEIGVATHLHLSLLGPAFTPLLRGVDLQHWPDAAPGFQYVLDPEQFSIGGRNAFLLYSRPEDAERYDRPFREAHDAAVAYVGSAHAADVDRRLWSLWQRPDLAGAERTTLRTFMEARPRLTAPIVDPKRRV